MHNAQDFLSIFIFYAFIIYIHLVNGWLEYINKQKEKRKEKHRNNPLKTTLTAQSISNKTDWPSIIYKIKEERVEKKHLAFWCGRVFAVNGVQ